MNGLRHIEWSKVLGWRGVVVLILTCWAIQGSVYWVTTSLPSAEAGVDRITAGFDRRDQRRAERERREPLTLAENQPTE